MTTSPATAFTGFPAAGLEFLAGIARDNTKAYFDANRTAAGSGSNDSVHGASPSQSHPAPAWQRN